MLVFLWSSFGVYEKGKTNSIDGAFYSLGLTQGDNKNGQYIGDYTFSEIVSPMVNMMSDTLRKMLYKTKL